MDELLKTRQEVLEALKHNLMLAQERMKLFFDKRHTEREFMVGDWVYLRLQPYRQSSLALRRNMKLAPKFFGPFQVVSRIGQVAYKLDLPPQSRLHPVFHVSSLKKKLGQHISPLSTLPPVDAEGQLETEPQQILQRRSRKLNNRAVVEVLVQWMGATPEEATWESYWKLREKFPHLVGKVL